MHTHGHRDEQAGERRTASSRPRAADPLLTLQAQAGNAAVAHLLAPPPVTIQRFHETRATNRRIYTVTAGGLYAIRRIGSSVERATVWVRDGTASPQFLQRVPGARAVTIGAVVYREHKPRYTLLQDCLHAAEEVINNRGPLPEDAVNSVVAATGTPFGVGDPENVAAALAVPAAAVDAAADAGEGQAFVIVNLVPLAPPFPFHAAAVVAADGTDRITLEQTRVADDDRTPRRTSGTTSVYTVGTAQSFHAVMRAGGYRNARTIVIARTPPPAPAAAPAVVAPVAAPGGPARRTRRAPDRYRPY